MTTQLEQFRQRICESLPNRADALMDLLDALSSDTMARSVVELSLNQAFRYEYSSVYDAIGNLFRASSPETASEERREFEQKLMGLIVPFLPKPAQRKFWLFGVDVTPAPRPFSNTFHFFRTIERKPTHYHKLFDKFRKLRFLQE